MPAVLLSRAVIERPSEHAVNSPGGLGPLWKLGRTILSSSVSRDATGRDNRSRDCPDPELPLTRFVAAPTVFRLHASSLADAAVFPGFLGCFSWPFSPISRLSWAERHRRNRQKRDIQHNARTKRDVDGQDGIGCTETDRNRKEKLYLTQRLGHELSAEPTHGAS